MEETKRKNFCVGEQPKRARESEREIVRVSACVCERESERVSVCVRE